MRDWLGLHRREKKEKGCKRNRGAKVFNGKDCSIYRKCIEIMVFPARRMGKEPFLFIEKAIGNNILLDSRLLFLRELK